MFCLIDRITITRGIREWFEEKGYICVDNERSINRLSFGVAGLTKQQLYHHIFYVVVCEPNVVVYLDHPDTSSCILCEVDYANPDMLEMIEKQILVYAGALETTTPAG